MVDRSSPAIHTESRAFDADAWGASPNWDPEAERSVYEDDDVDDERMPRARSLVDPEEVP
jgi:hypothetical protein